MLKDKDIAEKIAKKTNDKIIEWKKCLWTWETFPIFEDDKIMLEKLSPIIWWKKFNIPYPRLSPKAREINRLMFRNERKFYNIKLENWKNEISTIHPLMRKNIINIEEFNNYDFTKHWINYSWDFFSDFKKLLIGSPYASRLVVWMQNSPYCNQEAYDKNCHLNAWWHENEDSLYNTFAIKSKDIIDNYWVFNSEVIYESINVFESNKVFFWNQIKSCFDIYFWYDLIWCKNVIFWNNLENKNYVYRNEVLDKVSWQEKYKEFKNKLKSSDWLEELKKEFGDFIKETWKKESFIEGSETSFWNIITNSKDSFYTLYWEDNENVRYINIAWNLKNCMDISSFAQWEKLYNIASWFKVYNGICSALTLACSNSFYSFWIDSTNYSFWAFWFWLKNKSYLILNKEYKKEKWEKLAIKIIEELQEKWNWWEFLDPELSPYPYNDSVAYEYYPIKKAIYLENDKITKEELLNKDWFWTIYILETKKFISKAIIDFGWEEKINTFWRTKETEINILENIKMLNSDEIPEIDFIENNGDFKTINLEKYNIFDIILICQKSKRPFRITKKEFLFYKKFSLAIPKLHYDERHIERIKQKSKIIFE